MVRSSLNVDALVFSDLMVLETPDWSIALILVGNVPRFTVVWATEFR